MTRTRLLVAAASAAAALLLAGCTAGPEPALTVLPERPSTSATPNPTPTAGITVPATEPAEAGCVDGVAQVSGSTQSLAFAGDCDRLEITGNDLTVDLTDATARTVVVRGDRNDVEAGQMGALDIEGNDNEWDGGSLGALALRGDRNDIEVDADLGAVAVAGNDNAIAAGILGAVDDSGQRNLITAR